MMKKEYYERIKIIFEHSAVSIILADKNEKIISSNPFVRKMFGYKESDLLHKDVQTLYPIKEWLRIRKRHVRKLGSIHHLETKMYNKSKGLIDVDLSISILRDKDKNITGSIAVIRDIRKRKKAETELKESETLNWSTINGMVDALYVIDKDYNLLLANNYFLENILKGKKLENIKGKNLFKIFPFLTDKDKKDYDECFKHKRTVTTEGSSILNGRTISERIKKIPVIEEGTVSKVITIITDITDYKKAIDEISKREYILKKVNKAAESFLMTDEENNNIEKNLDDLLDITKSDSIILVKLIDNIPKIKNQSLKGVSKKKFKFIAKRLKVAIPRRVVSEILKERILIYGKDSKQRILENIAASLKMKSLAFIPLQVESKIWGFILSINKEERCWSSTEIDALTAYAKMIGLSVQNKRNRKRIVQERDKANQYLDAAGSIIIVMDQDLKITLINKKGCEVLEGTEEEILGRNWINTFIPKENRKKIKKVYNNIISGKLEVAVDYENPIQTLKRKKRQIAWHNSLVRNNRSKVRSVLSSGEDITENLLAKENIRTSEKKYRKLVENINDIFYTTDRFGKIEFISSVVTRFTGYTPDEIIGKRFTKFVYKKDRKIVVSEFLKTLKGKMQKLEFRIIDKHGKIKHIRVNDTPITKDNKVIGTSGIFSDITQEKESQKKIEDGAKLWSKTFDAMTDGVSIHSKEFKIINVNKALCQLLNKRKEDLIGKYCYKIFNYSACNSSSCPLKSEITDKYKETFEYSDKKITKQLSVISSPIDEDGNIIASVEVFRDITQEEKAEEELKKRNEELEKFNKFAIGRELRMIDLKKKLKSLEGRET